MMPDREKVEEWARDFIAYADELDIARDAYRGIMEYIDDALALLREQEPTKPTSGEWIWDRPHHFRCSVCDYVGGISVIADKYCPHCGSMMFPSETERKKEWRDERR